MKLEIDAKYKNIKWSLDETLFLIKNYNILTYKEIGKKGEGAISHKANRLGLTKFKRKTLKAQKIINNFLYKKTIGFIKYYNKNGVINEKLLKNLKPAERKVIINSMPKVYFNIAKKNTDVINFINKNKRMPSPKAKNLTERRLGAYVNMAQYRKTYVEFLTKLELTKLANGLKTRVGKKQPKAEDTFNKLVNFVKKNKRMPVKSNASEEEIRLRRFFTATATPSGFNPKVEWYAENAEVFFPYMDHGSFNRTKFFWGAVD